MDYNFAPLDIAGQKRGPTGTHETLFKRQKLSTVTDFDCRHAADTFSGNLTASSVTAPRGFLRDKLDESTFHISSGSYSSSI
jgi:hypothetical protein